MTQSFLFFLSFRTKPRFCRDSKSDAELSLFSIFLVRAYARVKVTDGVRAAAAAGGGGDGARISDVEGVGGML